MAKAKGFDFKTVEKKWRKYWEKEKIYAYNPKIKKVYSVDTPPPTVSGKMHIGHAFSYSQQDFIVRFRRMFEGNAFYPFGTDDNGLPTERLVEKLKKVKSKNMSRAEFIELCLKTLKKITPDFIQDWKDLGISADYNAYYSTIDNNSRRISQKFFLDLYKKKLAYKKAFPTIWCPDCQTSIAQAELEDKEEASLFSTLKFSVNGKDLPIATTRPELLGACVAVFVHPKDKRYEKIIGKTAKVPLFNYGVPVIADESADMEKGTGILMICSYGDKFDVDAINRHKLKPRVIINENGTLNIEEYKGLKIEDARKKILHDLKKAGLIIEEKNISHVLNVHDKCGTPIEFIPTEQWFIKILDKKKKFISQAKKVKWYPQYMFKRYENWVNGLEWDWSISRDRHFGVAIPVWYCNDCKEIIIPQEKELPIDPLQTKKKCPKCKKDAIPEEKVLDTWATSSLTPQIAASVSGAKMKVPLSLRPQAHDIIRTWAFYTIVRSFLHENEIPWKDIVISGNVSLKGEKMSKSKGNVVDPQKVLNQYGADALRFWASGSKLGSDLDYQEQDLIAGKKFINKLRNAARFVFMNLRDFDGKKPEELLPMDALFLAQLPLLVNAATTSFYNYEYSMAKSSVEQFFWKDFCDNYLELVKKRVYQGKGEEKKSAQYVLYQSLLAIVKMIAPIMPFITEEIYQEHFKKFEKEKSIHLCKWPEEKALKLHHAKFEATYWNILVELISKIRQEKSKAKKAMNSEIILTLNSKDMMVLKTGLLEDLGNVMNAAEIKQGKFKVEFI
jgi:valyl-tRNA synthetase